MRFWLFRMTISGGRRDFEERDWSVSILSAPTLTDQMVFAYPGHLPPFVTSKDGRFWRLFHATYLKSMGYCLTPIRTRT